MRNHRLARLGRLTQGAALLGASTLGSFASLAACNEQPHVNALPPEANDAATVPADLDASLPRAEPDASLPPPVTHTINALPTPVPSAPGSATPSTPASVDTSISPNPKPPILNSPRQAPKTVDAPKKAP